MESVPKEETVVEDSEYDGEEEEEEEDEADRSGSSRSWRADDGKRKSRTGISALQPESRTGISTLWK